MITIEHTRADGTLASGTRRGDGSGDILKLNGFRWFPSLGCFGVIQSRDKLAKKWKIDGAANALRAAGFEVTVTINEDKARSFAEAEADRTQRAETRTDRFADRAERAASRSTSRLNAAHSALAGIEPGQPILVGHHSERRHRRAIERSDTNMRASIDEGRKADYYAGRAEASANFQQRRENTGTTLRRIEKLEAERRRIERNQSYYIAAEYARRITEVDEQLTYWRKLIEEQQDGGVKIWSKADFVRGDYVFYRWAWFEVLLVNAKTLTIPPIMAVNHSVRGTRVVRRQDTHLTWTDRAPYHEISGRRSAEEMRLALEAEKAPAKADATA